MYNSRRVSRTGRTIQRRKVDTGITIDPTKVRAYMEYLLNNGYVQLPQPAPSPDGTYLLVPNADLDVSHLMRQVTYADTFIQSVLSAQNIFLTGTETVYMILETRLDLDNAAPTGSEFSIVNYINNSSESLEFYITRADDNAGPFVFLYTFCNGQYSISLLHAGNASSYTTMKFDSSSQTRTKISIFDHDSRIYINPKVTLISVGSE